MNAKQYNNMINWTLNHQEPAMTEDTLATTRAIFKNMGVALPNGTMQEVIDVIKSNNYMGWVECSAEEAQKNANKGIATIGIDEDQIVVISAVDEEVPSMRTAAVMNLSENAATNVGTNMSYYTNRYITTTVPTTYCSNAYLTEEQRTANAQYILDMLRRRGWTRNAICGMLGNMEMESTINPGIWEDFEENNMTKGFGLVQWTPATKYIDWANEHGIAVANINSQLRRILYEVQEGEQYNSQREDITTFFAFTQSTESPEYLAEVFMRDYEQPWVYTTLPQRQEYARKWFNTLT